MSSEPSLKRPARPVFFRAPAPAPVDAEKDGMGETDFEDYAADLAQQTALQLEAEAQSGKGGEGSP